MSSVVEVGHQCLAHAQSHTVHLPLISSLESPTMVYSRSGAHLQPLTAPVYSLIEVVVEGLVAQ